MQENRAQKYHAKVKSKYLRNLTACSPLPKNVKERLILNWTISLFGDSMDKAIKKEKKMMDKGMNKLAKMDKKNDMKHEKMGMKKAMKKKGC